MGELVGVSAQTVEAFERGTEFPSTAVVREYATLFGTRVEHFLAHGAARSPAALLFRSAAEHGTDLREELRASDLRLLGKFLARVADVHELERLLERPAPAPLHIEAPDHDAPAWEQGRICAERVRMKLGLGDEAVPSMVALLEDRLRWALFFVTPDELSIAVQGASTAKPQPGVLINLIGGRETWWRTRASLAHEMCHLLFDAQIQPYLLSPDGSLEVRGHWEIVEHFRALEQRANAFAAYFLVPSASLRETVTGIAPESDEAIERVCVTFGVSKTMAIRRLGHEFSLAEAKQEQMMRRDVRPPLAEAHADAAISPGLRSERLDRLVRDAVLADRIDTIQARSILGISMSEPLPKLGPRGAPLVQPERLARARAEAHAWTLDLGPCRSIDATRTPEGWTVVIETRDHEHTSVSLSNSFEPIPA